MELTKLAHILTLILRQVSSLQSLETPNLSANNLPSLIPTSLEEMKAQQNKYPTIILQGLFHIAWNFAIYSKKNVGRQKKVMR